ncbi:MAG: zinc ribbon domain-containing protein, partial [Pyrinomonadaceae bacterium]
MFCPKCGGSNPEGGKFCRSCGTDLGGVTDALSGRMPAVPHSLTDSKGRPMNWDRAFKKLGMGAAFVLISFILGASGAGRGWWFWMLIPAFLMLASGVAGVVQLKRLESSRDYVPGDGQRQ